MDQNSTRPWYKKKRYLIPIGIAVLLTANSGGQNQVASIQTALPATQQVIVDTTSTQPLGTFVGEDQGLSNNNYYTNAAGNTVHSPAHSNNGSVPAGASAQCRDGTYSFSQSRRGTCSHHGGVAKWL